MFCRTTLQSLVRKDISIFIAVIGGVVDRDYCGEIKTTPGRSHSFEDIESNIQIKIQLGAAPGSDSGKSVYDYQLPKNFTWTR